MFGNLLALLNPTTLINSVGGALADFTGSLASGHGFGESLAGGLSTGFKRLIGEHDASNRVPMITDTNQRSATNNLSVINTNAASASNRIGMYESAVTPEIPLVRKPKRKIPAYAVVEGNGVQPDTIREVSHLGMYPYRARKSPYAKAAFIGQPAIRAKPTRRYVRRNKIVYDREGFTRQYT
jgi:hypothetical protein